MTAKNASFSEAKIGMKRFLVLYRKEILVFYQKIKYKKKKKLRKKNAVGISFFCELCFTLCRLYDDFLFSFY